MKLLAMGVSLVGTLMVLSGAAIANPVPYPSPELAQIA